MPGVDQRQPALRHKAKGKTESQGHWKVGTEWCLFREEQRCHDRDKEELSGPEDMSYSRGHLRGNAEAHEHCKVLNAMRVWKN